MIVRSWVSRIIVLKCWWPYVQNFERLLPSCRPGRKSQKLIAVSHFWAPYSSPRLHPFHPAVVWHKLKAWFQTLSAVSSFAEQRHCSTSEGSLSCCYTFVWQRQAWIQTLSTVKSFEVQRHCNASEESWGSEAHCTWSSIKIGSVEHRMQWYITRKYI